MIACFSSVCSDKSAIPLQAARTATTILYSCDPSMVCGQGAVGGHAHPRPFAWQVEHSISVSTSANRGGTARATAVPRGWPRADRRRRTAFPPTLARGHGWALPLNLRSGSRPPAQHDALTPLLHRCAVLLQVGHRELHHAAIGLASARPRRHHLEARLDGVS